MTSNPAPAWLISGMFLVAFASLTANSGVLEPAQNRAPRADAGLGLTVAIGQIVTLDASGSTDLDGDWLSYQWTLRTPRGSGAQLHDAGALRPHFVVDLLGEYTAELVVDDGKTQSIADAVTISTGNVRPVAVVEPDVKMRLGEPMLLDGGASWDFNGDPLRYEWRVIDTPDDSRAALQSARSPIAVFAADVVGDYLLELIVSDGRLRSEPARLALSTANSSPQADAGLDRFAYSGSRLRLSGLASADADGDALAYRWSVLHAPGSIGLSGAHTAQPTVRIDAEGVYVVQLQVSDGSGHGVADTVVIEAGPAPAPVTTALRGVQDVDGDGIPDDSDNCAEDFNPTQLDTNGDGFGNRCDPDIDNDGFITNFGDLTLLKAAFFSNPASPTWNPDADFNGDNAVNFGDLQIMKDFFFGPPGPIVNRFINSGGGSWHEPTNWSLGVVPDPRHTVRIDIGSAVSVEYSTGSSQIAGLRSSTDFELTGGTLGVRGDVQIDASFTLSGNSTFADAHILAPITADQLVVPAAAVAALDGVILDADLTVDPGASLYVDNDLELNGTITLASNNSFTYLRFRGANGASSTLSGTGEVVYGGTTTLDSRNNIESFDSGHGLIVGPAITIRTGTAGGRLYHRTSNGPITIQGTVISNLSARGVTVSGFPLAIEGAVQVSNAARVTANFLGSGGAITSTAVLSVNTGELELIGDWNNSGTITVTDAVLDIGNNIGDLWVNNGTITLSNATLELGGSFTVADIGTVNGTGTVIINGSLDNTGQTLDVGTDLPGTEVQLGNGGEIVGGTIGTTPLLVSANVAFALDGVILDADLTVDPGASLYVDNGLELNGTITLASNNSFTYLRFRGANGASSTLSGTGEVVYGGTTTLDSRNNIESFDSGHGLIVGPAITIRTGTAGGQLYHRTSNGPITIQGTVISNLSARGVTVSGFPLAIEGAVQVSNAARVTANFLGSGGAITSTAVLSVNTGELELIGDWNNSGTITVTDAVLDIGNNIGDLWVNNGTITLSNATLELGGSFTVADIGTVNGTGTVIINGSLDNTGQTLDVGTDLPGTEVQLGNGGEIVGGTIGTTPLLVSANVAFALDGVILDADLTVDPGASLYVDNDLELNGTITLASNNSFTYLRFRGANGASSTLSGTGEVVYGGTTTLDSRNNIESFDSGHGLIVGPAITIRTGTAGGQLYHRTSNGPITIQSTVISNLSARGVTVSGFPLAIEGAVQVSNAARVTANFLGSGGAITSTAVLSVNTGELELIGDWNNSGTITVTDAVLDIGNNIGDLWVNNGTITLSNATLELGGSFTVADIGTVNGTGTVIINGSLDNTGQTLDVGTDLPGTEVQLGNGGEIVGGTIGTTPLLVSANVAFALDGVILDADLTVDPGASLYVDNDLELNGTITLASNNSFTYLRFRGANGASSTLSGTGEVVYGGTTTLDSRNNIESFDSGHGLIVGPAITIRTGTAGGQLYHRTSNGPITIQSTVISNLSARGVTVSGFPLAIEGAVQVSNAATVTANFLGSGGAITSTAVLSVNTGELELIGDWNNSGTITVTDAVLDIGNNIGDLWVNNGTITLSNATLELGGSFTVADIGTVNGTGTVIINGSLDNTGQTLDVGTDLPGTEVQLGNGGEIVGGTIGTTPLLVSANVAFALDGVILDADLTVDPGASLYVDNGLELNGTITLASNNSFTYLRFRGANGASSTLSGTGEVVYGGTTTLDSRNNIESFDSGHGLIVGPAITIRTGTAGGQLYHRTSNGPITIQGTVISNLSARGVTVSGFPLAIEGTLQAGAGSVINFTSDYSLTAAAAFDVDIGGAATPDFGRFTAAGRTANLDGTLNISIVNAFAPSLSDTFEIMTFATGNGAFATENGTTIGGGLFFQINYNTTDVTLEVVN